MFTKIIMPLSERIAIVVDMSELGTFTFCMHGLEVFQSSGVRYNQHRTRMSGFEKRVLLVGF